MKCNKNFLTIYITYKLISNNLISNFNKTISTLRFRLKQDGVWCDVDMQTTSILEIHFPVESLVIKPNLANSDQTPDTLKHELAIDCTPESTAQLLALAVDHIDILLEDWYPTLGTRFVHTSEGKFLVTRLVPCPKCLALSSDIEQQSQNSDQTKNLSDVLGHSESDFGNYGHRIRKSQVKYLLFSIVVFYIVCCLTLFKLVRYFFYCYLYFYIFLQSFYFLFIYLLLLV